MASYTNWGPNKEVTSRRWQARSRRELIVFPNLNDNLVIEVALPDRSAMPRTFAEEMDSHAQIIDLIATAFANESGPARCGNPRHCEECEEADQMLLDLDPRDLNFDDLSDESRNWIFSFATDGSIRWLAPGAVRVALQQSPPQPRLFFDLSSNRTSDVFSDEQWIAVIDLAEYCFDSGWISRSDLGFLGPGAYRSSEQGVDRKPDHVPS